MKKFKKLIAALLVTAMSLTLLVGCGSKAKSKTVYDALKTALGSDYTITVDSGLEKDARAFGNAFLKGTNLTSDQKNAKATATVSADTKAVWDIIDHPTKTVMPIGYDTSTGSVSLLLPYSENDISMIKIMNDWNIPATIRSGNLTKVGASIVDVKGDKYVIIIADK